MSKIDKIASTETYRYILGNVVNKNFSYNPLKVIKTDINHVNGAASVGIKQGYKEVNLKTNRGLEYNILKGSNFEADDFASATSLNDWGTLTKAKLVSTWGTATIAQETFQGNEVASLDPYLDDNPFTNVYSATDSGGKITIHSATHGLTTSDWILIADGNYLGIWNVVTVTDGSNFIIDADYVEDEEIKYIECTHMEGIETNYELPLGNNIAPVSDDDQNINIEFTFNVQSRRTFAYSIYPVVAIVMVYNTATSYKILDSNGQWQQDDLLYIKPIIANIESSGAAPTTDLHTMKVTGTMSDAFFSTRKMYIGLMALNGQASLVDVISYNSVKVWISGKSEETNTTAIEADYVSSLNVEFFHSDSYSGNNDEFIAVNTIYDDATPKEHINSWQQDGATADNLQDIIQGNLVAAYTDNSQIWRGTLKGDLNIGNAVKDPLNVNRVFQIQKITKNLTNEFNNVSMIEILPSKSYNIELISSIGSDTYYHLAEGYGDISALFTGSTSYEISSIKQLSDNEVLDTGGARNPDGASSFISGRVRILVSDGEYTGASVSAYGVLRIL